MPVEPLRIVTVAPLRFPIRLPHAGGLESALWNETRRLRARGHSVTMIAVEGSDFLAGGPREFVLPAVAWAEGEIAADDTYPAGYLDRALPALERALDRVADRADELDVVVNHCLHGVPLRRAGRLGVPMVSTLHTPVVPELVEADVACDGPRSEFLSVSRHTRAEWARVGIESTVLANGVDGDTWVEGPGGAGLVWFGRLVPEKGAHLAIEVARSLGLPLILVGRIGDRDYFDTEIAPRLGRGVEYAGVLAPTELAALVGRSACALATPVWEEPFGLVVPEALLCGTPVAAFGVGGILEMAVGTVGLETAPMGDVAALADVVAGLLRQTVVEPSFRSRLRASAAAAFSLDTRIDRLEQVLRRVSAARELAA
ncbi:glycosyltransferase [Frigoribacterium sp. 2-23]|uniref:glycosyltransferase n=1 Tax=Frigoribacterium sp. 2-23 TaxID=3415006 RepID=UPI003C6EB48A